MNSVISNLVPGGTGTPAAAGGGLKENESTHGADFLRALVAVKSLTPGAQSQSAITDSATIAADAKAQCALEARIAKMIDSGASQADITKALASGLASTIATGLDAGGSEAHAKLQTIFAAALAPPGDAGGATGSVADRARILAQRFLRLKSVANAIAEQQVGQQNRIAGNFLDAHRAKDIPARTKIDVPAATAAGGVPLALATERVAFAPTVATASAQTPPVNAQARGEGATATTAARYDAAASIDGNVGALAQTVNLAAASVSSRALMQSGVNATGDGRTVKLGSRAAIGSGGDTTLGRVLARASLAADARETALVPLADGGTATTSIDDAAPDAAVSAFVKAFEAALNAGPAAALEPPPSDAQGAPPAPIHRAADTPPAFVPGVAPFTIERADTSVAAPIGAHVPVDHSAIADQVLRGAFMRNTEGSSEMRLRLVPDSLGDVNVKLVVTAGNVTAHVVAETPQVRDALVAAQPQLAKSLADAGLKLTNFTVDLSGSGFTGFSQQQNDRSQFGSQSRQATNTADTDDGVDETLLDAIPSFGPSLGGKPGAGDYNYLA